LALVIAYTDGAFRSRCGPSWARASGGAAMPAMHTSVAPVEMRRISMMKQLLAM
jgi:hypothetical protein